MGSVRRGYISFLFMAPLALLLLMPLTLQREAENSLASVYPADSALAEQVSLKRALIRAAHSAILEAKDNITNALTDSAVVFGIPKVKMADVAFDALSEDQKLQAVQFSVLRHWSQTLREWNQHSDYTVKLHCTLPSYKEGASAEFDQTFDADSPGPSFSSSWQLCGQLIQRDPNLALSPRPFILLPGLEISVEHKFFNYSGASPIRPQEVGS